MKRFLICILAVCLLGLLVACDSIEPFSSEKIMNSSTTTPAEDTTMPAGGLDMVASQPGSDAAGSTVEKKTLIAYFLQIDIVPEGADASSHATPAIGSTESAAIEIQKQVGGDLFAIKTVKTYPMSHQECSAIAEEEIHSDTRPELSTHVKNMNDYDTIYIGYPIWWHQEPMAIRSFLEEYDFSGKTVIPFCTSLGVSVSESEDNIKSLLSDATVLSGVTLRTGRQDISGDISDWLSDIGMN